MYESTRVKMLSFLYGEYFADGPAAPAKCEAAIPPAKANTEHTITSDRRDFWIITYQYDAGAARGRAESCPVGAGTGWTRRRCRFRRPRPPGCPPARAAL